MAHVKLTANERKYQIPASGQADLLSAGQTVKLKYSKDDLSDALIQTWAELELNCIIVSSLFLMYSAIAISATIDLIKKKQ